MKRSMRFSNFKFHGILYYDKEGNSTLSESHPEIKKFIEDAGNRMLEEWNKGAEKGQKGQ